MRGRGRIIRAALGALSVWDGFLFSYEPKIDLVAFVADVVIDCALASIDDPAELPVLLGRIEESKLCSPPL